MSLSSLLWSAYERLWTLPTAVKDLSGRTVIITGANVGLGLEAAKSIYAMNPARSVLAVRSVSKGEDAKRAILFSTTKEVSLGQDRGETKLEVWELDLASFKSVKAFAERCINDLDRLDVLLNNAAIAIARWTTTADGWETTCDPD
ncbi:hypothetical protein M408DRAFT_27972 [Serendipita vermifera MAFF 305830]|uniref:Ketoreductase (KR) domain-containing protein n=1 Tax=Serendipita vermifera MAFF 305830 TaxID=933852 RepID=A0A0C3AVJ3_SERVB|nr:hypothetical protein M408DRAFT_27972 [Serendipita vermifera MAFF 305830]